MFLQKLQAFMYGRYGSDRFNLVLLIVGLILSFVARWTFWPITVISYLLYGFALYRMLSKNIPARQRENQKFLALVAPIREFCMFRYRAFKDRNSYKYFKCPNCRQALRAPRGRGKILVSCQKCRKQFEKIT